MEASEANRLNRIIGYYAGGGVPFLDTKRLEGYRIRLQTLLQSPLINGLLQEVDRLEAYTQHIEWERDEIAFKLLRATEENGKLVEEINDLQRYVEICLNQINGK